MGSNTEIVIHNRKKAAVVFAVIAGLLCFIGLFGTIMTANGITKVKGATVTQLKETFDLVYIFSRGWNTQYVDAYYSVSKFALALMTISFFIGTLGCLFALGKTIYSITKREEVNFKFNLAILLVSSVQYIFMSRFLLGYDGYKAADTDYIYNTVYLMGWGAILITFGFFLGLIAIFLHDYETKESVLNKNSILTRIASIAIFFVGLYALTNMISIGAKEIGSNYSWSRSFNAFSFISYLNDDVGAGEANFAGSKALGIIAVIFGIISLIGAVTSAFFFVKGADNKTEKKIVNFSTISFVAASLISNIFMIIAGHVITKGSTITGSAITINIGFTFIVSLILGIGLILLVYFRDGIFKKTK